MRQNSLSGYQFLFGDGVFYGDIFDAVATQRYHIAKFALGDEFAGMAAELGGKIAIKRCG